MWYIVVIIIIALLAHLYTREDFATRRDKASSISEWFAQNTDGPKYNNYKAAIGDSDIVEFEKVRNLYAGGASPSINVIERVL